MYSNDTAKLGNKYINNQYNWQITATSVTVMWSRMLNPLFWCYEFICYKIIQQFVPSLFAPSFQSKTNYGFFWAIFVSTFFKIKSKFPIQQSVSSLPHPATSKKSLFQSFSHPTMKYPKRAIRSLINLFFVQHPQFSQPH